jgi:hypothetical protein
MSLALGLAHQGWGEELRREGWERGLAERRVWRPGWLTAAAAAASTAKEQGG